MKDTMATVRSILLAAVLAQACVLSADAAQPQQPPPAAAPMLPGGHDVPAISAGQIQRWFEAFTVLQAQEALQLSEAQYGRFVTRLKSLQETRRKHQQSRNQILGDLRRLTNPETGSNDEAAITERLKALRDADERAAADLKKTYDGVDETLDIRQQARFRLFEEKMEQQKLELLMRARANARSAVRGRGKS
jgi:opacity protein-like surface antigen